MKHKIDITPYRLPVELQINGERLTAITIEGSLIDPESRALFPEASASMGRYYETPKDECETIVTLHFHGPGALRAREILARLMGR